MGEPMIRRDYMLALCASLSAVDGSSLLAAEYSSADRQQRIQQCVKNEMATLEARSLYVQTRDLGFRNKSYTCDHFSRYNLDEADTQSTSYKRYLFEPKTVGKRITGASHRHDLYARVVGNGRVLECQYCAGGNWSGTERGFIAGYCWATAFYKASEFDMVKAKQTCMLRN